MKKQPAKRGNKSGLFAQLREARMALEFMEMLEELDAMRIKLKFSARLLAESTLNEQRLTAEVERLRGQLEAKR